VDTLRTLRTKLRTPCGHRADSRHNFFVAERYSVSKRYGTYVGNIFESCMIKSTFTRMFGTYVRNIIFESCMIKYIYLYLRTYIFLAMRD
jgi:hypothetical protein